MKRILLGVLALALASPYSAMAETVLRVSSTGSDIAKLDPHRASSTTDKVVVGWMFNGLVRFAPGSADPKEIEADLAESWERSPDGTVWTFRLRKGVRFHGSWGELTADDVVYSLKRAADPARSSFAGSYAAIAAVEAPDPHTVRITLKHPVAGFLGLVANYHGGNIVSRRAAEELGAAFDQRPVGTGPFAVVEHVTQQHLKLAAHAGYFRGRPAIDTVMYRFIPSDAGRELAFASGELDLFYAKRASSAG
jgi:peptide/nickel transport system substrate-binding protein